METAEGLSYVLVYTLIGITYSKYSYFPRFVPSGLKPPRYFATCSFRLRETSTGRCPCRTYPLMFACVLNTVRAIVSRHRYVTIGRGKQKPVKPEVFWQLMRSNQNTSDNIPILKLRTTLDRICAPRLYFRHIFLHLSSQTHNFQVSTKMFKFVNAGEDGSTPKRQQSQRACSPCRKRKKRCHHTEEGASFRNSNHESPSPSDIVDALRSASQQPNHTTLGSTNSNTTNVQQPPSQFLSHINHTGTNNGRSPKPSSYHRPPNEESMGARFIGDLNPESVFLAASPDESRDVSTNSVGIWVKSGNKGASKAGAITFPEIPPSSLFHSSTYAMQTGISPLLKQECLATLPPPPQLAALSKIYFDKMHPMFPVIDFDEFHKVRKRDNCQVLLQQAVCLAASKNFAAKPHLILGEPDLVLSSMEFGDKISGAMRLAIEMGMVTDKVVLIQALALMSQFFDSVDRGDLSSQ